MIARAREDLRAYLQKNNLRYTPERELIVREIARMPAHFDVEELFLRIRKNHPAKKIAKASIYRNVRHFMAAGIINETVTGDGRARYEYSYGAGHHDHLCCVRCGKIIEFTHPRIETLQKEVCRSHQAVMVWHKLEIGVLCRRCAGVRKQEDIQ